MEPKELYEAFCVDFQHFFPDTVMAKWCELENVEIDYWITKCIDTKKSIADQFDDREYKEINFSKTYLTYFNHGTSGHLAHTVIARLAKMVGI